MEENFQPNHQVHQAMTESYPYYTRRLKGGHSMDYADSLNYVGDILERERELHNYMSGLIKVNLK